MRRSLCLALLLLPIATLPATAGPADLVLITLDTVRADELGCYGGAARTPNLDRLAAGGVRFARALSPVPLTLPAHASLLTGLDPLEHGLRDNGGGVLPAGATSIAELLRQSGYRTIAVVGSRVLDRRFGLDRGFDFYDDRMAAERTGEFGYAERPASEVVDAALAAAGTGSGAPGKEPLFLWVHFYDAHAPYQGAAGDERVRYRSEIEEVDRQVGRLLEGLRGQRGDRPRWVIAVGDHGESFGEHGEREHGYLLHEATLAVPMIVHGPGTEAGTVLETPVTTRRVAATLAALAGLQKGKGGDVPGPPLVLAGKESESAFWHETEFPASTFGWSPLAAVTRGRWRFVDGPHPALYDLVNDPGEASNRLVAEASTARSLRAELRRLAARRQLVPPAAPRDAELSAALESLGYLSGATARRGTLDPAEGILLLPEFEESKRLLAAGDLARGRSKLRELVRRSPLSVPFLSQLAAADRQAGDFAAARRGLEAALGILPTNEFVRTSLASLEIEAGRPEAAERAFREALQANPRHLPAWLGLGELLKRSGRAAEEERLLRDAVAAECESGAVHARLAEIALGRNELATADRDARRATELLPGWPAGWSLWAEVARRGGDQRSAEERAARARALSGR